MYSRPAACKKASLSIWFRADFHHMRHTRVPDQVEPVRVEVLGFIDEQDRATLVAREILGVQQSEQGTPSHAGVANDIRDPLPVL